MPEKRSCASFPVLSETTAGIHRIRSPHLQTYAKRRGRPIIAHPRSRQLHECAAEPRNVQGSGESDRTQPYGPRKQQHIGTAVQSSQYKKWLSRTPSGYTCSVDMGGTAGKTGHGSVVCQRRKKQCFPPGCTQKAVQANILTFSSAGTQTEAKFPGVQADTMWSGVCRGGRGKSFAHRGIATRHWQDQHAARPVLDNTRKSTEKLESTHTGEGSYACMFCLQCYHQEGDLATHERLHMAMKPYACGFCPKVFRRKMNLVAHVNKHAAWKLYACRLCGKDYLRKGNLTVHERTHTGERHYTCKVCPSTFRCKSDLEVHERAHDGVPNHREKSRLRSNLIIHKRVEAVEKRYACATCPKVYRCEWDLANHVRVHTGERPFACHFCPHRFTRSFTLGRHEKEAHSWELEQQSPAFGTSVADASVIQQS